MRMCVACRRTRPKQELVRIVRDPAGVRVDQSQRLPGRGAYLCPDPACVAAATRRGARAVRHGLRGADLHDVEDALAALDAAVRTGGDPE
ncbi:MAG: YlxR family protein [Actinobacteria bacterium]|nr:YlxR family protein [Actinomycetota bacterium]